MGSWLVWKKLIDRWVKLWFNKHAWRITRCNGFVIRTGHNVRYCYAYVRDGGYQALDKIQNSPLLSFLLELKPRFKQVLHFQTSPRTSRQIPATATLHRRYQSALVSYHFEKYFLDDGPTKFLLIFILNWGENHMMHLAQDASREPNDRFVCLLPTSSHPKTYSHIHSFY